jgi:hypothetical protein
MKYTSFAAAFALVITGFSATAAAQTRTPWEQNDGEGLVSFLAPAPRHGDVAEYDHSSIPSAGDAGWVPAPDESSIGYSVASTLCNTLACRFGAQFTYFQTFVEIPAEPGISTFTIVFDGIDDGVRTTIYNSLHPDGVVVPGSYVFLGGAGTANLASLVVPGEVNRVVVTHVDDCCATSTLWSASVVLDGRVLGSCPDVDDDGVCDSDDDCPDTPNVDQADGDRDGIGDACDTVCAVVQRGTYGNVQDTFVTVQSPGEVSGTYPYLYTGTHSSGDKLALVRFDLDFIPPGSFVTSAKLSLSQQYSGGASTMERIHQAKGPWSEATARYSNYGGYATPVEASFATIGYGGGVISADVTGTLRTWVEGWSPNYGFAIEENLQAGRTVFRASEHSNIASRPKLEICYIPFIP